MEQDDGFGFWIWGVTEVKEVAVGSETTNDVGAWGSIAGEVLTRIFHTPSVHMAVRLRKRTAMRVRSNSPNPVAPSGTDRPTQRSEGRQARLDRNGRATDWTLDCRL